MDLRAFTEDSEKKERRKVLVDNNDVKVVKIGNEVEFFFKSKDAMRKYQDLMFFSPTNSLIIDSENKAQEFFELSIKEGVEGVMMKSLSAQYKPGARVGSMAKVKETKEDIDVVILGAEYGQGKRAGFYSSFFVGVQNEEFTDDSDRYLEIGKVSSGIKELGEEGASLSKLKELLEPLRVDEVDGRVNFEPKIVIQVRYQEIQKSTAYNSGYALRFPRIIALREDKVLEEINSIEDIGRFV